MTEDDEGQAREVLEEFKRGVAQQLADAGPELHFDLGIAYAEIGLWADAIDEFEQTLRATNCFHPLHGRARVARAEARQHRDGPPAPEPPDDVA